MFVADDVLWLIIVSSMISNFVVEIAIEGVLEYGVSVAKPYLYATPDLFSASAFHPVPSRQ